MPAYNAALYISEAIESLLNQTFRDFELWILNDGSQDDTSDMARSFHDSRMRIFDLEQNIGRVAIVNQFITKVQTEFVTVTDADDISAPARLQKQIDLLDGDKDLVMCGTSYHAINESGFVILTANISSDWTEIKKDITEKSMFHGPTTVMRTSAIAGMGEFYRHYFSDHHADADLCARLTDVGKSTNISEALYLYRIVPDSVSRRNFSPRFAIVDKLIGFLARQRQEQKADCIMTGDVQQLLAIEKKLLTEFEVDPSLIHFRAAFFHLYWGMFSLSVRSSLKACQLRPLHIKNILALFYVALMASMKSIRMILFGQHYRKLKFFIVHS
ncbi:MAG: glycosyltransferase family 2 protein [Cyclobacteriaceae bacterium]|nr:glycosyltransferase family 2 protein [Cyclobacteriaceae bacterium]